jgi:hypothetical protein
VDSEFAEIGDESMNYVSLTAVWLAGRRLHAEPRTPDGFDGVGGPADFDLCRRLTTEEIEQQLAWKSSDANRGFPSPGPYGMCRPSPLKLKPCAA